MPRGFKRDLAATRDAYASGRLIDVKRRSFISEPKAIPGECDEPQPHLILYGADRTAQRMKLFQREGNRCETCKCVVAWGGDDDREFDAEFRVFGEWQHIRDKGWNKCDCLANARLSCHNCHQGPGSEHFKRRPRFGAEKVAV